MWCYLFSSHQGLYLWQITLIHLFQETPRHLWLQGAIFLHTCHLTRMSNHHSHLTLSQISMLYHHLQVSSKQNTPTVLYCHSILCHIHFSLDKGLIAALGAAQIATFNRWHGPAAQCRLSRVGGQEKERLLSPANVEYPKSSLKLNLKGCYSWSIPLIPFLRIKHLILSWVVCLVDLLTVWTFIVVYFVQGQSHSLNITAEWHTMWIFMAVSLLWSIQAS